MENQSLNAFLSRSGVGSRRFVVELIKRGRIFVNNELQTNPAYKVQKNDIIKYKDKIVKLEKKIYILLNKPKGYITTASDEKGRKTVIDLVSKIAKERLYPVGRLDRDTTGLLLITNDGYLSQKLAHPRNNISKKYYVILDRMLEIQDFEKIKRGIFLEDGKAKVDKIYFTNSSNKKSLIVEIHSGKNRIIKRIFGHLGYKVILLDRIYYAGLTKKGLSVGYWRFLTTLEVETLMK